MDTRKRALTTAVTHSQWKTCIQSIIYILTLREGSLTAIER